MKLFIQFTNWMNVDESGWKWMKVDESGWEISCPIPSHPTTTRCERSKPFNDDLKQTKAGPLDETFMMKVDESVKE